VVAPRHDVIVIGAGPAGCAAAISAARSGARVLVLDRARFPRPKTCGDALSNRAAEIVARLAPATGLPTIPHARVERGVAILPGGAAVERGFGDDPGFIAPRRHLDAMLASAAAAAGAELREGVAARGLVVERTRVVGVRTDGESLRGAAVIAADGPGSIAWGALARPYPRGRALALALTAYFEGVVEGAHAHAAEHFLAPELRAGYAWIFPAVEGVANVGVYQRADRFHAHGRTLVRLLDAFVDAHPHRFDGVRAVGRPRVWALPLAVPAGPPAMAGLLLAGDAACAVDPLAGEGIWQALHTGELAGTTAARALDRGGVDRRTAAAHRRRCARDVGVPGLVRMLVQDAMDVVLAHRLDRFAVVRALLGRGYASERLEASKRVG
jgi:geranylgeranyl reductase family protein